MYKIYHYGVGLADVLIAALAKGQGNGVSSGDPLLAGALEALEKSGVFIADLPFGADGPADGAEGWSVSRDAWGSSWTVRKEQIPSTVRWDATRAVVKVCPLSGRRWVMDSGERCGGKLTVPVKGEAKYEPWNSNAA